MSQKRRLGKRIEILRLVPLFRAPQHTYQLIQMKVNGVIWIALQLRQEKLGEVSDGEGHTDIHQGDCLLNWRYI
jgi:hypothetical protein